MGLLAPALGAVAAAARAGVRLRAQSRRGVAIALARPPPPAFFSAPPALLAARPVASGAGIASGGVCGPIERRAGA